MQSYAWGKRHVVEFVHNCQALPRIAWLHPRYHHAATKHENSSGGSIKTEREAWRRFDCSFWNDVMTRNLQKPTVFLLVEGRNSPLGLTGSRDRALAGNFTTHYRGSLKPSMIHPALGSSLMWTGECCS